MIKKQNINTHSHIEDEQADIVPDTKDIEDSESVDDIEIISNGDDREDTKLKKIQKELQRCKKERRDYLDGWQRTKADYVNSLRRFEQDVKNAKDAGVSESVKKLLPVLESLQRARSSDGKLPDGFDAILKQITSAFTALNVTEIQVTNGDTFDPVLHEALSREVTKDTSKDNTISKVLESGWKLHDVVMQPAKVSVAYCQ